MSDILVFLQQNDSKLTKASLVALKAAMKLKEKWSCGNINTLTLGAGAKQAAEEALDYGVAQALYSEAESLNKYLGGVYAQAFLQAVKETGSKVLVTVSSSTGKDFFPRVAAALDAGQASDILGVNEDGTLLRPMYAGNALADVEIATETKVITVRSTAFDPATTQNKTGSTKELNCNFTGEHGEVVSYEIAKSERPELGDAEIVVSGGRALQSEDNFKKYIYPLADAFGAAIGASRAAVDSGYAPNDWQVGQTGKVVAPSLYVAVGISGAIQHLAGMKDSKIIVAINKDPDAPIFEVADYGLVADLYEVVEPLTAAVKQARAS